MPHSINEAEFFIEKLLKLYKVSNVAELSNKINTTQQTISNWNQRKSISALKKVCRELGIYNEIFKNTNKEDLKIEVLENKFDQFLKDFVKNNL